MVACKLCDLWCLKMDFSLQFENISFSQFFLAKDILTNPIWNFRDTKQSSTWLPLDSISILPIEFPVTPQAGFVPLQRKQPILGEGCVLHSGSATLSRFLCGGRSRFRCDPPPCLGGCDPFLFLLRILQRRRIWSKGYGNLVKTCGVILPESKS